MSHSSEGIGHYKARSQLKQYLMSFCMLSSTCSFDGRQRDLGGIETPAIHD